MTVFALTATGIPQNPAAHVRPVVVYEAGVASVHSVPPTGYVHIATVSVYPTTSVP